jgi:integrase
MFTMQAEMPKITYFELLEKLRNNPDIRPRWKTEIMSAVRQYAKRFEPAGMGTVIVPAEISAILAKATPAMARLRESSFSNMISRLRVALRLCGIIVQPGRHTMIMAEPWATLFKPISNHTQRSRLSRFFYTATRRGWKPEEITAEHLWQFHQELSEKAIIKHPDRVTRETAKCWNNLADQNPGLPHVDFALPKKREPYTFGWDRYPETLGREIRELMHKLGDPDMFREDQSPPLRQTTLRLREFQLRQFAAAVVHRGRSPSDLMGLRELCTLDNFKEGLRFFYDRAGGKVTYQVLGIAETIYATAKHHPQTDLVEFEEMTKRINGLRSNRRKSGQSGLTEKNHRRLAQFDAPRNRDGILLLPQKLWRTAAQSRSSGHFSGERAAAAMMTAVSIELLLMCPMRVSNLASLDLKIHVRRTPDRGGVTTHIYIPRHETKNGVEINFELPASSARMLEEYIEYFRPGFPGAKDSSLLFPGRNGSRRRSSQFWKMITEAGRQYLGVEINPHLFRHLAAKLYLDEHPGGYEVVRRTLGHNSLDTTSKFYAGQEAGRSIRHYDRTILKLRDEASGRPQSAGPRRRK